MTDGSPGVTVVGRIIHFGIVKRGLQYARREVNVVHARAVVGIDGGRGHPPFAAIYGLADLVESTLRFEHCGSLNVSREVVALDRDRTIVTPLVRIADLIADAVQFGQRILFGLGTHPGQLLDVRCHGLFDLVGHGQRALLHLRTKSPVDELLAQGFAKLIIDQPHTALPAGPQLRCAAKCLAEELEVLIDEGLR